MRRTLAILLFLCAACLRADTAHAISILAHREQILYLRKLPPKLREVVQRELGCDTAIGFHYHRIYVVSFCDMKQATRNFLSLLQRTDPEKFSRPLDEVP